MNKKTWFAAYRNSKGEYVIICEYREYDESNNLVFAWSQYSDHAMTETHANRALIHARMHARGLAYDAKLSESIKETTSINCAAYRSEADTFNEVIENAQIVPFNIGLAKQATYTHGGILLAHLADANIADEQTQAKNETQALEHGQTVAAFMAWLGARNA